MSITPGTDGWVEWTGGENPVPGQMVVAKLRCGHDMQEAASEDLAWNHPAFGIGSHDASDIIAYRVVTPPVSPSPSDLDGAVERLSLVQAKIENGVDRLPALKGTYGNGPVDGSILFALDLRTILQALSTNGGGK